MVEAAEGDADGPGEEGVGVGEGGFFGVVGLGVIGSSSAAVALISRRGLASRICLAPGFDSDTVVAI
ncbi:hypothetical protein WME77_36910 [Sorangium sp. So ce764]|uniref:hypothetical protein n=1 Tax=Sorangium sp. So ce764 TaxID=3133320 RepID=UPI003F5F1961